MLILWTKDKMSIEFECKYYNYKSSFLLHLDLEDNDWNTNWCECNKCGHEFRQHDVIIRKKK